jgi:hypothetical protein
MPAVAGFPGGSGRCAVGGREAGPAMFAFLAQAASVGVEFDGRSAAGPMADDDLGQGGPHGKKELQAEAEQEGRSF